MEISAIKQYSPSFRGISKLTQALPDGKVSKGLTLLDQAFFATYLKMPKYNMQITPADIKYLSQFDGNDFLVKSYEFIAAKFGWPEDILPGLYSADLKNSESVMGYNPMNNIIFFDQDKLTNQKKSVIFSLLRHEFQHFSQNLQILRHEEIGQKALKTNTKRFIEMQKNALDSVFSTYPEQTAIDIFLNSGGDIEFINKYLIAHKTGNTEWLDSLYKELGKQYINEISYYRNKVIEKLGLIKKDSCLTPQIEKNYKEFTECGYYNPDGSIDFEKYFTSDIELEALDAQTFSAFEFSGEGCFMKFMKNEFINEMSTEDIISG